MRRCAFWASPAAPWSMLVTRGRPHHRDRARPAGSGLWAPNPSWDGFRRSWRFWRNREKRALHGLGELRHHKMHVGVQRKHLDRTTARALPLTTTRKVGRLQEIKLLASCLRDCQGECVVCSGCWSSVRVRFARTERLPRPCVGFTFPRSLEGALPLHSVSSTPWAPRTGRSRRFQS